MRLAPTPRPPRLSRAALIALVYLTLGAIAFGIGIAIDRPNVYLLPGASPSRTVGGVLTGVLVGLAFVAWCRVAVRRFSWMQVLHDEFRAVLHPISGSEILVLALASSVGEELFFRGALLQKPNSLILSSVLFAACHFRPQKRFLPWTAMAFGSGLVFGLLFLWFRDLGAAIAAHFTINFLNLHHIVKHPRPAT